MDESSNNGRECWCCGATYPTSAVVALGSHPEVAICSGCARFLVRRSAERRDQERPGVAARARQQIRAARSLVIEHQWHQKPIVGRALRWLDKYLP